MAPWEISLPQNISESFHQMEIARQTVNDTVSKWAGTDPSPTHPLPGEGLKGSPFSTPLNSPLKTPLNKGDWGVRFSEFTNSAINTVNQATDRVIDKVAETTEKFKDSFNQTATKAVNTFTQATHKTVENIAQTAEQAKDSLTQTTINAVDTVTSATNRTVDRITETTSNAIENSLIAFMNQKLNDIKIWIDHHPALSWVTKALAWVISHPFLGIIIIILSIFALQRFIRALGQFLEQAFLLILQAPFKFGQFLFALCLKPFARFSVNGMTDKQPQVSAIALNTAIPPVVSDDKKERLTHILKRLEALRQEETDLLQEVTSILTSNENLR